MWSPMVVANVHRLMCLGLSGAPVPRAVGCLWSLFILFSLAFILHDHCPTNQLGQLTYMYIATSVFDGVRRMDTGFHTFVNANTLVMRSI